MIEPENANIAQPETLEPAGRRAQNKIERRQHILAVSKQVFLEHGYVATTMSAIAAQLGGSKGTLWSYFPNKTVLFVAVLEETISSFRQELADILQPSGNIRETLYAFCENYIYKLTSERALATHRLIIAEVVRDPTMGSLFYERVPQQSRAMLGDYLAGQMERGVLRQDDSLEAARVLIGLCTSGSHHYMLLCNRPPEGFNVIQEAHLATDVFLRAYAAAKK